MASPDERAVTLKKIDEIEAQMSQQWWKSKQGADAPTQPGVMPDSSTEASAEEQARAYAPTVPGSLSAPLDTKPAVQPLFADDSMAIGRFGGTDATMLPGSTPHVEASFSPAAPTAAPAPAFEPEEFVHEPDLEEAAIRFANGDHAGAESGLLEVLAQHQQDDPAQQLEIWMTLFDLYRATGQHDRFDTLAIDFAAQYGRSAPLWFSIPAQLGLAVEVAPAAEPAAAMRRDFSWNAPPTVAVSSVAALQASLARAASPGRCPGHALLRLTRRQCPCWLTSSACGPTAMSRSCFRGLKSSMPCSMPRPSRATARTAPSGGVCAWQPCASWASPTSLNWWRSTTA